MTDMTRINRRVWIRLARSRGIEVRRRESLDSIKKKVLDQDRAWDDREHALEEGEQW